MIGLTTGFAEVIVLCGHGAQTENNAYQSALECGACGGHQGAPNARVLAKILNNNAVRAQLLKKGSTFLQLQFFFLHSTIRLMMKWSC